MGKGDRHADTGYGVKDTPEENHAMMYAGLMAISGEERMEMGFSMMAAAREMVLASLPEGLSEAERKRAVYERVYGEALPEGAWERLVEMEAYGNNLT